MCIRDRYPNKIETNKTKRLSRINKRGICIVKRSTIAIAHKVEDIREKIMASGVTNSLNDQRNRNEQIISNTGLETDSWKSSIFNQFIACFKI